MKNMKGSIWVLGLMLLMGFPLEHVFAQTSAANQRYKIAVVDLMILKRQKLGAFQLTKDIGADGVEVDMGGLGDRETFDNQLAKDSIRKQFLNKAKELNLQIPSMGMTGFFAQSFAERPIAVKAVTDCINTMKLMNIKVGFLPMGIKATWLNIQTYARPL